MNSELTYKVSLNKKGKQKSVKNKKNNRDKRFNKNIFYLSQHKKK